MEKKKEVKNRIIRIKLVDGTKINGQININKEDGYDRLSDLVGSSHENFLVLSDATSYQTDIESTVRHKVLFVNKHQIVWASPEDTEK